MKLLANENFPLDSVKYLVKQGFDIIAIGTDNASFIDREVMELAIAEERVILTFDRDYGELIFRHNYRPEMGVIYLRIEDFESHEPGVIIEEFMLNKQFDTKQKLTVISSDNIRQKTY
jgi:predicted nuclease of predicted toxin-antitoxin system